MKKKDNKKSIRPYIEKAKKARAIQKKYMLVPSPIKAKQLLFIFQRTPREHIYHRPAKGGGEWDYVTGVYVKKVLNYVFGWMWDFEIIDKGREGDLVWVQGKLTIKDKKGKPIIIKEQFGRADMKFKRGTKIPLDYGNDLKAAATDALKKCASELGIASDIYGKNEFKEIEKIDKGYISPVKEIAESSNQKIKELKIMLKGKTDKEKLVDLKKRTGINLETFEITERHAGILIASLLNKETK